MSSFSRFYNVFITLSSPVILGFLVLASEARAQQAVHPCWQGMVQIDSVQADLAALTAPGMEGRGTGQSGYLRAADFVASQLQNWNLIPVNRNEGESHSFLHPVPYLRVVSVGGTFKLGGRMWKMGPDFVPTARRRLDSLALAPTYRIKCASNPSDGGDPFSGITIGPQGFSILIEGRYPFNAVSSQTQCALDLRKKVSAMGCKQVFYRPTRFTTFRKQWEEDEGHRPRIRLLEATRPAATTSGKVSNSPPGPIQEYAVSGPLYRSIRSHAARVGTVTGATSGSIVIHSQRDSFTAPNVVGMIRGKTRPDEYVFLTAHLDHLGVVDGTVYAGADDNGSGSTVLLSVARALSQLARQNIHPDRSIVLVWFSGEENGLLGSRWMTSTLTDSMGIGGGQVFANINMDMLGRHDAAHGPDDPYLYVVHHHENQSIRPFTEQVNTLCGDLKLDYSYSRADDPERLFMRSDHYAFHQLGIPAFFLFSGLHEDYHKPTDTADKISVPRLTRNAGFVLNLAWQIAQRNERLNPVEP